MVKETVGLLMADARTTFDLGRPLSAHSRELLADGALTLPNREPIWLEDDLVKECLVPELDEGSIVLSHRFALNEKGRPIYARVDYRLGDTPDNCKVTVDVQSITEGLRVTSSHPRRVSFTEFGKKGTVIDAGEYDPYDEAPSERVHQLFLVGTDVWQQNRRRMITDKLHPEYDNDGYQMTAEDAYALTEMLHGKPAADKEARIVFSGRPIRDYFANRKLRRR